MRADFDHIPVDEYQDTNRLQAAILLALAPDGTGSPWSATTPSRSVSSATSISKSNRSAMTIPRTARVKLTIPPEQKQNQRLPSKITRIPKC
jgi:superfamily I DNA/RNA helicase